MSFDFEKKKKNLCPKRTHTQTGLMALTYGYVFVGASSVYLDLKHTYNFFNSDSGLDFSGSSDDENSSSAEKQSLAISGGKDVSGTGSASFIIEEVDDNTEDSMSGTLSRKDLNFWQLLTRAREPAHSFLITHGILWCLTGGLGGSMAVKIAKNSQRWKQIIDTCKLV